MTVGRLASRCGNCFADRGFHWLLPHAHALIDIATNDACVRLLRMADFARFADLFRGQPDLVGCKLILLRNKLVIGASANLATFLRRVILIGQPALSAGLAFQRIGLRAVRRRDQKYPRRQG